MILSIKNLSYLLASSGASSGLIDADISFTEDGFPYLPARRIKGILRESMMEVVEMTTGGTDYSLVLKIFGDEGDAKVDSGTIRVDNAYLKNWKTLENELAKNNPFTKEDILNFFTVEISQTTLEKGVAKKRSLRNYRVLKPECEFFTELSFSKSLEESDLEVFTKSVLNLRYMGTRRNRGFGKIKCQFEENGDSKKNEGTLKHHLNVSSGLKVEIKTLNPLILSKTDSDQNTVSSFSYISGSKLRGLFVNEYIKERGAVSEDDEDFYDLFLSGNISFGNLNHKGAQSVPLNIHYVKDKENKLCDVFSNPKDITKAVSGFGQINEDNGTQVIKKSKIKYSSQFHLSRQNNRTAGTSTDSEGSIFYYSAVAENQSFEGEITGKAESLQKLAHIFPTGFEGFIGKSISAQYGKVNIRIMEKENIEKSLTPIGNIYLIFTSPVILFNELGVSDVSERTLLNYLKSALGEDISIENRATSQITTEQFNIQWNSKTEKLVGYNSGSVFEICSKDGHFDSDKLKSLGASGIGELKEIGFGRVNIENANHQAQYRRAPEIKVKSNSKDIPDHFSLDLLNEIADYVKKKRHINEIKSNAIQGALNGNLISNNHLSGIMIIVFRNAKDSNEYEYVKEWLDKAGKITENKELKKNYKKPKEPKPAYKSLQRAGLVNRDNLEESELLTRYKYSFSDGFIYWTTFFQTMQKRNKREKGIKNNIL